MSRNKNGSELQKAMIPEGDQNNVFLKNTSKDLKVYVHDERY